MSKLTKGSNLKSSKPSFDESVTRQQILYLKDLKRPRPLFLQKIAPKKLDEILNIQKDYSKAASSLNIDFYLRTKGAYRRRLNNMLRRSKYLLKMRTRSPYCVPYLKFSQIAINSACNLSLFLLLFSFHSYWSASKL